MHIAMISDLESSGGAAIAASRLAEGLSDAGHRITRIVSVRDEGTFSWSSVVLAQASSFILRGARRLLPVHWKTKLNCYHSEWKLRTILTQLKPDVINIHNIHGSQKAGWSTNFVEVCLQYAPAVWTLHDMWSFTGRCTYSYDCPKFLTGCDSTCPTHDQYPAMAPERIAGAWRSKKRILSDASNIAAVSPSQWLADLANQGMWNGHPIKVIRNGLPLDRFKPVSRAVSREALGLSAEGLIVLLVSASLDDPRKANQMAAEVIQKISDKYLTVLTMGKGRLFSQSNGALIKELGPVIQDRIKVLAYSAASLVLHPSLIDNLPNVVSESLACGTPVLGFNVGGLREMVRPQETGWLASEITSAGLENTLQVALQELRSGLDLRESCREAAESEYDIALQVQSYLALFEELLRARGV